MKTLDRRDHRDNRIDHLIKEVERLRKALEEIDRFIDGLEQCILLPNAKDTKKIWNIARAALTQG